MDEEFNIEYSDEESEQKTGFYSPPPETIEKLYSLLNEGKLPELKWESPGYRPPTPKDLPKTPTKEDDDIKDEQSDFDFMDEMNAPRLPVRREGEAALKGSAKKKTTSLDGVLSNMRRHWKLDQQMSDGNKTKSEVSNTTTNATNTSPVVSSSS